MSVPTSDTERMIELWVGVLRGSSDYERGYHAGRFEEYAAQNAITPDEFPAIRTAAQLRFMVDELVARDESGRCIACGSDAGDEFHCADCGLEVSPGGPPS